jgi:hypothetical protein
MTRAREAIRHTNSKMKELPETRNVIDMICIVGVFKLTCRAASLETGKALAPKKTARASNAPAFVSTDLIMA